MSAMRALPCAITMHASETLMTDQCRVRGDEQPLLVS